MKKIPFLLLTLALVFLQPSCNLTETNIDPNKINDVKLRFLLPAAISQTAFNQTNTTMRIAGSLVQQFEMGGFCGGYANYRIPSGHFTSYWKEGLYTGSLKDCQVIIDQATEQGQPYYAGIAKILMAKELGNSTLMFGDMPLSEALKGLEHLRPVYDPQEEVIKAVFQLLDESIVLLGQDAVTGGPHTDDLIFNGNTEAWIKTAWALKARYHMHMSRRDPDAATKVLDALDEGAFTSLEEQPTFQWGSSLNESSPLARFAIERQFTMSIDKRFSEKFLKDDPRLPHYAFQHDLGWQFYDYDNPNRLFWSKSEARVPLISFVEVAFLKTEALWRSGANASSLQSALEEAVVASMEQIELEATDYQNYTDSLESLANMGREEQLEYIMIEAYKAYFGYASFQTWTNYRRTGYPALKPSSFGSHGLNPEGGIPKRYLYPDHEEFSNSANLEAAKARQNGALMDQALWIFK